MAKSGKASVAIIGGGFAGLTAARALKGAGIPFELFEASSGIAGLATTFKDEEGFSYDFGTHLITNRLAATIGVEDQCRPVPYFGETVFLRGTKYSYPFGLMAVPGYLVSALGARLTSFNKPKPETADAWLRQMLGSRLADDVAIPLVEALNGVKACDLAASIGDKLPGVARTVYLRLAGRLSGKAVAIGYSRDLPEAPSVWHTYPVGGISMLCAHLAKGLEDEIHLESRIEKIVVDSDRVVEVQVNGRTRPVSIVISTAPVNILAKLVDGSDAVKHLSQFRYSPMLFVNLRFLGRKLLGDVVLWTPERSFPFFRLQEASVSMPWLAPEGKTLITADIGCEVGDEFWAMSDDELGELCVRKIEPIIPDARRRYLGCRVLRTRIAYPILLQGYEEARRRLEKTTGIEGLYSVGRNGEFAHILMEDVYHRTLAKMQIVAETMKS